MVYFFALDTYLGIFLHYCTYIQIYLVFFKMFCDAGMYFNGQL